MARRTLALSAIVATVLLNACAQLTPDDHAAHHPADSASTPAAGASAAAPGTMDPARMEQHMKAMREMHIKMANARTPEERQALMAEHMKLMQEGMAMMGGMGPMGSMGMMGGMGAPRPGDSSPSTPAARMQRLEQRMDMMQSMMQMMMDRMPAPAAKP